MQNRKIFAALTLLTLSVSIFDISQIGAFVASDVPSVAAIDVGQVLGTTGDSTVAQTASSEAPMMQPFTAQTQSASSAAPAAPAAQTAQQSQPAGTLSQPSVTAGAMAQDQSGVNSNNNHVSLSGPSSVAAGATATYTATISNDFSGGPIKNATIVLSIPGGFTFVSGSSGCVQHDAGSVWCSAPNPIHQSESASFTVTYQNNLSCGQSATITSAYTAMQGKEQVWQTQGFWFVQGSGNSITINMPACPTSSSSSVPQQNFNAGCYIPSNFQGYAMNLGETKTFQIPFINNGNTNWNKDGNETWVLKQLPSSVSSAFTFSATPMPSNTWVPPGNSWGFLVTVHANAAGSFLLAAELDRNGVKVGNNTCGANLTIVAPPPTTVDNAGCAVATGTAYDMNVGETKTFQVPWTNNGTTTWKASDNWVFNPLPNLQNAAFSWSPVTLTQDVAPGATFTFNVTVHANSAGSFVLGGELDKNGQKIGGNTCGANLTIQALPPPPCTSPLTYQQVKDFASQGKIIFNQNNTTGFTSITNNTDCSFPASLAVYKMFNPPPNLDTQVLFSQSGTKTVTAHATTNFQVQIPTCAYQIDLFYGDTPTVLSNALASQYMTLGTANGVFSSNLCTNIPQNPNLTIQKTVNVSSVAVNGDIKYTVTVTNNGNGDAKDVVVRDAIPAGLTNPRDNGACHIENNTDVCPIGTLAAGQSKSIDLTFAVASTADCKVPLRNTATVNASNASQMSASAPDVRVQCPQLPPPQLTITKVADKSSIAPNNQIKYTITVKNTGGSDATNVVINDPIPVGLTNVFDNGGCAIQNNIVTCPMGTLTPGQSKSVDITFTLAPAQTCNPSLSNTANAAAANVPAAVYATSQVSVQCPVATNNAICSSITLTPDTLTPGQQFAVNMSFGNNGNTVWMPGQFKVVSLGQLGPSPIDLQGQVQPNGSAGVQFNATAPQNPGTYTVAYQLQQNGVSFGAQCSKQLTVQPGNTTITINKYVDKTTVKPGESITYTLNVKNTGNAVASNVEVQDSVPAGLQYQSSTAGCSSPVNNIVKCFAGTLNPSEAKSFSIVFLVPSSLAQNCPATSYMNQASITAGNAPTATSNSVLTVLQCTLPTLEIVKTALQTTVGPNKSITYSITVKNKGQSVANSVTLMDHIPQYLNFQSSDAGCSSNSTDVTCLLNSLQPNEQRTVNLTFSAIPSALCDATVLNTATATITGIAQTFSSNNAFIKIQCDNAKLVATKTTQQTTIGLNGLINYQIRVENQGQSPADNVIVIDTIPPNTQFQSSDAGCVSDGTNITCQLNSIPANQSRTVTLTFQVLPSAECNSVIYNKAHVQATNLPEITTNIVQSNISCNPPVLQITKTASQAQVNRNGSISYAITVKNTGQAPAANVVINDNVPAGLTFQSSDSGCVQQGPVVTCSLSAIPANQSRTVTMNFLVSGTAACNANIFNSATVQATGVSPLSSNTAQITVQCTPPQITLTKTPSKAQANLDDTVSYAIQVSNGGQSQADNVAITDQVPVGLIYQSSDSNCSLQGTNVVCSVGSIPSGQSKTVNLVFKVATTSSLCGTPITNTATAQIAGLNQLSANAQITIQCAPANLVITKTPSKTFVNRGDTVTYAINVTNAGQATAPNAVIVDHVPTGLTYVSSDSGCSQQVAGIVCNLGDMTSHASKTVNLAFMVDQTAMCFAPITNTATIQATGLNPVSTTATVSVQCPTNVSFTKSGPTQVSIGDKISYTLDARNNGQSTANNVQITDTFPAGFTYLPAESDGRCALVSTNTVRCSGLTLASGDHLPLMLKFQTPASTADCADRSVTNNATLQADQLTPINSSATTLLKCIVIQTPNLSISKSGDSVINRGDAVHYTITVSNTGGAAATNVTVTDPFNGSMLSFNAAQSTPGCNAAGATVTCGPMTVNAGETKYFNFVFNTQPSTGVCSPSTITNQAFVMSTTQTASNIVTTQVNCPQTPKLTITKAGPASVMLSGIAVYTVSVQNTGTAPATNVVVTDPVGLLTLNTAQSTPGCTAFNETVTCNPITLNPGETKIFTFAFNASISPSACPVTVNNQAFVDATNIAHLGSNVVTTQVICPVQNPNLTISKSGPASVQRGNAVTYAINVTNTGNGAANNVVVTDNAPPQLQFASASQGCSLNGGNITCQLGSINAGETKSITLTFNAPIPSSAACVPETANNTATVVATGVSSSTSNMVTTAITCPQFGSLSISKVGPDQVTRGNTITYTLHIFNSGNAQLDNIQVRDPLVDSFTFVSSSNGCSVQGSNVVCPAFSLAPNASNDIMITLSVPNVSYCSDISVTNIAYAKSPAFNNGTEISAQKTTTVKCPAFGSLSISKAGPDQVMRGSNLTYTLHVFNSGTAQLDNIQVRDPLVGGLTFVSASDSCSVQGSDIVCPAFSLAANAAKDISITLNAPNVSYCSDSTITNIGYAKSPAFNNGTEISAQKSTLIKCNVIVNPQLKLTKSAPGSMNRGGTLVYTFLAENIGDATATSVKLTDIIPQGLGNFLGSNASTTSGCTFQTLNGSPAVVCELGDIAAHSSKPVSLAFDLPTVSACSQFNIQNTATVSSNGGSFNAQSNTVSTTVLCPTQDNVDLSVVKSGPSVIMRGSVITYTLTVNDSGTLDGHNVFVTDSFPSGFQYNAAASTNGCTLSPTNANQVVCGAFSIGHGETKYFNLSFNIPSQDNNCSTATVTNNALVTSSDTDTNQSNNSSSVQTQLTCPGGTNTNGGGGTITITNTNTNTVYPSNSYNPPSYYAYNTPSYPVEAAVAYQPQPVFQTQTQSQQIIPPPVYQNYVMPQTGADTLGTIYAILTSMAGVGSAFAFRKFGMLI